MPGTPTSPPTTTATNDPSKPSPTQANVIKTCTNWYKVVSGDGCQKVVDKYGTFTLADFYKWNPDVGTDCSGLPLDTYVCVGVPGTPTTRPTSTSKPGTVTGTATPTPTQTGVSTTCRKWYYVVKGDGCQVIADKFKITLANLYVIPRSMPILVTETNRFHTATLGTRLLSRTAATCRLTSMSVLASRAVHILISGAFADGAGVRGVF